MLRVLGRLSSINVRKVVWLCSELGIAYEREDWGAGFRDPREAGFLALNPNGLVPVIVEDGFVLWESSAILRYLAAKHDGGHLLGGTVEEKAIVDQWLGWQTTELNAAWGYAVRALVRKLPGHDDPALLERSIREWGRAMAILEDRLAQTGAFVAGGRFSLADIGMGLAVQRWLVPAFEKPDYPHVRAYHARLLAETAFARDGVTDYP